VEGLKRTHLSLTNLIMERGRWGEIYNELATIMPDNMWITSIEGVTSIENDIASVGADANNSSNDMSNGGGFGGNRFNRQQSQQPMPNGPEEMQDPSMMGGESYSQVVVSKDITAIKVKAYGLILDQAIGTIWNKALNSNIRRSTLFVHDKPEDVVIRDVTQGEEKDNVLGFTMYLKLKKPIKMD
jgi:hypothetical protein